MSRGPGVWQRKILEALEKHEIILTDDILPTSYTYTQRSACARAISVLADSRRVSVSYSQGKRLIARPHIRITADLARRWQLKRNGLSEPEIHETLKRFDYYASDVSTLHKYRRPPFQPWMYSEILSVIGDDKP